jgi:DNA-binding NarL/FixJ family response regulator
MPEDRGQQLRILLVDLPRMLRDLVLEIVNAQRDLSLVGEVSDESHLLTIAAELEFEVVIACVQSDMLPPACRDLLAVRPTLIFLAIESDGRQGYVHSLRPHTESLAELSPSTLLAAIRRTAPTRDPH